MDVTGYQPEVADLNCKSSIVIVLIVCTDMNLIRGIGIDYTMN